jgi:PAS domain S-box-containing protein
MGDGFIEQDPRGVITGWSAEAERLYGWSGPDAIGMRSHRLVPERNRARHDAWIETFLSSTAGRTETREITALHRDGHEFRAVFELSIAGRDGAPVIAARVRAVTPEERAESAFGPGGDRYRAIRSSRTPDHRIRGGIGVNVLCRRTASTRREHRGMAARARTTAPDLRTRAAPGRDDAFRLGAQRLLASGARPQPRRAGAADRRLQRDAPADPEP